MYLNFRQSSEFFVNFYAKFRQYISRLEYLKKFRNQLKIMNALLDKVSFQLRIVYDNLLKPSKTLKEIKAYFIRVNNRHKVTRKTREKKKFRRSTEQLVFIFQNNSFHFFLDRLIRLNFLFLFVVSSIIVNKKMLTKMFISIVMNKVMLQQIVRNRKSELFRWTILIQYLMMIPIQCTLLMNQIRIMSTRASTLISNEKIKFFCENYDRKKGSNFVQNNHRRFNQCRFKVFLAQVFYQT